MKLYDIKTKSLNLIHELSLTPPSFLKDRLMWSYKHHIHNELKDVFQDYLEKSILIERLKNVLNKNWELTKDTCLSYTCLPNHPITKLMLGIAVYLAKEEAKNHCSFNYLMPGLELESINDAYPDLSLTRFQTSDAMIEVLQTHILSQDAKFLIPVKLLTTLDPNDSSPLNNPYFNYETMSVEQAHIQAEEIIRLYSHSHKTKMFNEKLKTYQEAIDKNEHLLGRLRKLCRGLNLGSRYGEGSELQAGDSAYSSIIEFSDYYHQLFRKELYRQDILPSDLEQFEEAYLLVQNKFLYYIQDGRAQPIEIKLKKEFDHILNTINESLEDGWVSCTLSPLAMYYLIEKNTDYLTIDSKISHYLQQEIRNLINYVTDSKLNLSATVRAETCVATIRQSILTHICGQEDILSSFKSSPSSTDLDVTKLRETALSAQVKLKELIDSKDYNFGCDRLENFGKIIEELDIHYELSDIFQLKRLLNLTPENCKSIFKIKAMRLQAIFLFADVDHILEFMLTLTPDQLKLFVTNLHREIRKDFIKDIDLFCYILAIVDSERAGIIFNALGNDLMRSFADVLKLTNQLSLTSFQLICHSHKSLLMSLFSVESFVEFTKNILHHQHKSFWLDSFLAEFKDKLETIELFRELHPHLSPLQSSEIFIHIRNKLIQSICNVDDLNFIMQACPEGQKKWLYRKTKDQLPRLANSKSALITIMQSVPQKFFQSACINLASNIETYIKTSRDLGELFEHLNETSLTSFALQFHDFIFRRTLLDESIDDIMPYLHLFSEHVLYRNLYHQLLPFCEEKLAYQFIKSLAQDQSYLKHDFDCLFRPKSSLGLFANRTSNPLLYQQILTFPEPELKKIFSALMLDFPRHKDSQKRCLIDYIYELEARPSHSKKNRFALA